MLPVESLTEAVYFLQLYDLDAVLVGNRLVTVIASKCVKRIPVWQFDRVDIWLNEDSMPLMC